MKTYEGLFIFSSSLKDEERKQALEKVYEVLTNAQANVLGKEELGRRSFARPIKKRHSGYYVRVLFESDPQAITKLIARFKLNNDVLRIQLLVADKTVVDRITGVSEPKVDDKP
ncbi:30S ribosomal protein S6, partial [PVC group bacterium]|nr:30S ribosomal protein S6 [PVC group bacterium]